MIDLPLFPLNTVLFPGMPLKLHIFEERYKLMINECVESQKPFGVVLIESGDEALGALAHPHLIGTTAYITQVQRLPFGRMNILAIGKDRFRITSLSHEKPYLSGLVDLIPLVQDDNVALQKGERQLRPLLNRYLAALSEAGLQFEASDLPEDALALAYLSAVVLQTDSPHKQQILEAVNTSQLLQRLISTYRREVAMLDVMLTSPANSDDQQGPFSYN
jgi:Lon protease-like protein